MILLRVVLLFCVVVLLPCSAEEDRIIIYDSADDTGLNDSDMHIQFHQRKEEEKKEPLRAPAYTLMAQPCTGWYFQQGITLYNADSDRELLLLTSATESVGAVLALVALDSGASVSMEIPGTAGAWALSPMTGDRVAIGTYYDGAIHIYSLEEDKIVDTVDLPGEAYVWNLVTGKDGRLYGGSFPGGKLFALDQNSLLLEDCGQVKAPNHFLHEVSALPDGRILCRVGTEAPGLYIYDPVEKSYRAAPDTLVGVEGGRCWQDYFVTEKGLFDADLEPVTTPPFPLPEGDERAWAPVPHLTTATMLFVEQGKGLYRFRQGDSKLTLVHSFDLRGGRMLASTVRGGVAGVRGQQYFQISSGSTTWKRHELPVMPPLRTAAFLRMDGSGQLWGGPAWGQTLFFMDGTTGVATQLTSVSPRLGGVRDMAFTEGASWGVSYPDGEIFRLDIEQAWQEWDGKNPMTITRLGKGGYHDATGGIVAYGEELLYSGWSFESGGGAIAVTDPTTQSTKLVENPLGKRAVTGLALNDDFLFAVGAVLSDKEAVVEAEEVEPPLFAVFVRGTVQPCWNGRIEGSRTANRLCFDGATKRVVLAVDDLPRVFDVERMQLLEPFTTEAPPISSLQQVSRNDGYCYYGSGKKIIRLQLVTGQWEEVLALPEDVGAVAAGQDGVLFAACGIDIYRVDFPEPYADIVPEG